LLERRIGSGRFLALYFGTGIIAGLAQVFVFPGSAVLGASGAIFGVLGALTVLMPDLIVYLRASTPVLMQRIAFRDRPYERNMELEYIDRLNRAYDEFFGRSYDGAPVLTVDTDALNIIENPAHLRLIENSIRERLNKGPFQPSLLLNGLAALRHGR
jgi:hypothetical protein